MPLYEFQCKKCKKEYSEISSFDKTGKYKDVSCPHCKSKRKQKLISGFSFAFTKPEGTDLHENSHDYRFKHALHKKGGVVDQRKISEEVSHVGPKPYDDLDLKDVETGKFFGEVK